MTNTNGTRTEYAPDYSRVTSSTTAILSVSLHDNETVKWNWSYTAYGSYVSGYTIITHKPS